MNKSHKLKQKITNSMDLPKEVMFDMPNIKMTGFNELYIENHKGIIEYGTNSLRINTTIGVVKIVGNNIVITEINEEEIRIIGDLNNVEFIK